MRHLTHALIVAAISVGTVAALPASAQMGPRGARPGGGPTMQMNMFHGLDANKDGKLSPDEMGPGMMQGGMGPAGRSTGGRGG